MAPRLGLWVNKARIFLGPLRGKLYGKYLAWYLKMIVGGGAKTLKYVRSMTIMMMRNLLSLVD
jgi:hypothetical protein